MRLEDRREFADERLRALAHDSSPEVRRRAVVATSRIGDKRGVSILLQALADSSESVRIDAAFGLGLLRDTTSEVIAALANQALQRAAPTSIEAGAQAVFALGRINTEPARAVVEQALTSASPRIAQEALLAIWKFKRTDAAVARVIPHLAGTNTQTRWRAAYALARMGGAQAGVPLLHAVTDADPLVRSLAMRGLRASVVDSANIHDRARGALTTALADSDAQVRINALRALASYKEEAIVLPVAALLQDNDGNVAITAAQALADLKFPASAAVLSGAASDPTIALALRGAALASLARVSATPPTSAIERYARDAGSWLARYYAARALEGLPLPAAETIARLLIDDADVRVATAALESLVAIDTDSLSALPRIYIQQLGASDPMLRAAALRGLQKHASADLVPIALDAFDRAAKDKDNDAATAAIDLLGAIVKRGVHADRPFYARFERSPDPVVRREAVEKLGLGAWGEASPVETGHDQTFYEQVVRTIVLPALISGTEPRLRIHMAIGDIVVQLAGSEAPLTAYNMITLAAKGYFNGGRWHRVVPNFVLQDGDPRGDGNGGPGYSIRDEMNRLRNLRGSFGMALSGPDTGGSQFFITFSPQPHLDAGYTVFGRVVTGMDIADKVVQDEPILSIDVTP